MSDCEMPEAVEIERLILGAIITSPDQLPMVSDLLAEQDFSSHKHRLIYSAMKRVSADGRSVDYRSLYQDLSDNKHAEAIGGLSYLAGLAEGLPEVFGLDGYCGIVLDKAVRRRAIQWGETFIQRCSGSESIDGLMSEAEKLPEIVSAGAGRIDAMRPLDVQEAEGGINSFLSPELSPGIKVPFPTISRTISGLRKGRFIVLGATPGTGKTAFAWQCAEAAAIKGKRVLFVSLEMKGRDLLHRAITGIAGVSSYKFRHGELDSNERESVMAAWGGLSGLDDRLLIYDRDGTSVPQIAALVRSLEAKGKKPDFVVVDYIQILASSGRNENRANEVALMSRGLLSIARRFDIPLLALSQLNRPPQQTLDSKSKWEPGLDSLKESSQIGQDAHQVMFLWSKEDAQQEDAPTKLVQWAVKKNRDGAMNRGKLVFHRRLSRFAEEEKAA